MPEQEPVTKVVGALRSHAEEKGLVSYDVGERLHVMVDPGKFEALKNDLKALKENHGFKMNEAGEDLLLTRKQGGVLGFGGHNLEVKLLLKKSRQASNRALERSESAMLTFDAHEKHELSKEQLKEFTGLLNKYGLKRQNRVGLYNRK